MDWGLGEVGGGWAMTGNIDLKPFASFALESLNELIRGGHFPSPGKCRWKSTGRDRGGPSLVPCIDLSDDVFGSNLLWKYFFVASRKKSPDNNVADEQRMQVHNAHLEYQ